MPNQAALEAAKALASTWDAEYRSGSDGAVELVEIELGTLTYLFDVARGRVVGVYGTSVPTSEPRPAARMRGHPSYNVGARQTDRGHLVAHSLGGGADINLVAQDHALNVSRAWRRLERRAQRTGSFIAVQVKYDGESDRPCAFVYTVLDDGTVHSESFENPPA